MLFTVADELEGRVAAGGAGADAPSCWGSGDITSPVSAVSVWLVGTLVRMRRAGIEEDEQLAVQREREAIARELHDVDRPLGLGDAGRRARRPRRAAHVSPTSPTRRWPRSRPAASRAWPSCAARSALLRGSDAVARHAPAAHARAAGRAARRGEPAGAAGGRRRPAPAAQGRRAVRVPDHPGGPDQRAQARPRHDGHRAPDLRRDADHRGLRRRPRATAAAPAAGCSACASARRCTAASS